MQTLVIVILALIVFLLWLRLTHHHRAVAALRESLLRRRMLLRDDLPGVLGPGWDELCSAASELVAEVNRLDRQHSGQLAQLEATLGSLQEAVLLIDAHNYVLLANQAFHAIFPKAGRILGERLELALHSDVFLRYVEAVRGGRAQLRQEIEFVDTQGSAKNDWKTCVKTLWPMFLMNCARRCR
jgi:two-component system phosphate regulon sensor histidine kinase PhoR